MSLIWHEKHEDNGTRTGPIVSAHLYQYFYEDNHPETDSKMLSLGIVHKISDGVFKASVGLSVLTEQEQRQNLSWYEILQIGEFPTLQDAKDAVIGRVGAYYKRLAKEAAKL